MRRLIANLRAMFNTNFNYDLASIDFAFNHSL
jgi:hypothetical protein